MRTLARARANRPAAPRGRLCVAPGHAVMGSGARYPGGAGLQRKPPISRALLRVACLFNLRSCLVTHRHGWSCGGRRARLASRYGRRGPGRTRGRVGAARGLCGGRGGRDTLGSGSGPRLLLCDRLGGSRPDGGDSRAGSRTAAVRVRHGAPARAGRGARADCVRKQNRRCRSAALCRLIVCPPCPPPWHTFRPTSSVLRRLAPPTSPPPSKCRPPFPRPVWAPSSPWEPRGTP